MKKSNTCNLSIRLKGENEKKEGTILMDSDLNFLKSDF